MKKFSIVSFLLVFCLLVGAVSASATRAPYHSGDADLDGNRTVKDATLIQKYTSRLAEFSYLQSLLSDTNEDGVINVKDATMIQKALAKLVKIEAEGVFSYSECNKIYADFSSGRAMVGVPVAFTIECGNYDERANPITYELYINDELIEGANATGKFAYTFETAGEYKITFETINKFGYRERFWLAQEYKVVEPYESEIPVVKAFYSHMVPYMGGNSYVEPEENVTFEAEAMFGKGDYKYAFYLDGKMLRDYSADNTYTFETLPEAREEEYILTVRVKDSSTGDSYVYGEYPFYVNLP